MCAASKIAKNSHSLKTPFIVVQGRSRSLMFPNQKSLSPVFVIISRKSVPICNRFHTIQGNNDKIMF